MSGKNCEICLKSVRPLHTRRKTEETDKLMADIKDEVIDHHSIHDLIANITPNKVKAMIWYSGDHSKKDFRPKEARERLAKICFQAQPKSPMSHLISLETKYKNVGDSVYKMAMKKYEEQVRIQRGKDFKEIRALNEYKGDPLAVVVNEDIVGNILEDKSGSKTSDPLDLNNEKPPEPKLLQQPSVKSLLSLLKTNDPSVVVDPEASKEELITKLKLYSETPEEVEDWEYLIREKLLERLEKTLKRHHPIHTVIARMSLEEVRALICYSGDSSKVFGETKKQARYLRDILANNVFKAKPESPLTYLNQLHNGYEITGPVGNKKMMQIFEANVKEEELSKKSTVQENSMNQMDDLSSDKNRSDTSNMQMDISEESIEQHESLTIKEEFSEDILKECNRLDEATNTFNKRDPADPSILVDPGIQKCQTKYQYQFNGLRYSAQHKPKFLKEARVCLPKLSDLDILNLGK